MDTQQLQELAREIAEKRNVFEIHRVKVNTQAEKIDVFKAVGDIFVGGDYKIDENNRFVIENCLNWLFGWPFKAQDAETAKVIDGDLKKGLFIAGPCGTGKSVLLNILAAISVKTSIQYGFGIEKIDLVWKDDRADEICNDFILSGAEVAKAAKTKSVLCINDLGSEVPEQIYMGNRVNILRQILESRGDQLGKFTVISSNFQLYNPKLIEKYGDRVVSRLKAMCNYFEMKGADRRK